MGEPAAPLVENLGDAGDPIEVAARFLDLPFLLLLDSGAAAAPAGDQHQLARYSFLTADPARTIRSKGRGGPDPLIAARELLAAFATDPVPGIPPFQGGIAGYIGYDYGAVLERVPEPRFDDLAIPDVILGLYDWVIAWDHGVRTAWIISTGLPETGRGRLARAEQRLAMVRERLRGRAQTPRLTLAAPSLGPEAPTYPVLGVEETERLGLRSTFTHRGYLDAVTRVRDYIVAGDIFQANISQRLQAPLTQPAFELYGRLRRGNPAAFAAYLDFGELQVMSASPEWFLRVDEHGRVETRPIKGTRPRGHGPMHDAALGRALAESDKDRAENVMIVDLLRNDLSRVCRPGSVRVPELFALEQHPTVHHLVSTVVGELETGCDAVDLLRAAFPGGSITGAPKVRAMEIIAELEPSRRGVYCGSIGYVSTTGAMDTSIVIRTYLALRGRVYFQAGGGIVADSDPELENRETLDKARALIAALSRES
jgi:para-aminobenzoate synthetase component 1